MCGIIGFNKNNEKIMKDLLKEIKSRGPDQEGIEIFKNLTFGFRRLSIQDLSENGSQPMFDKKKKFCIIFNGEIFNFKELRTKLEKKGYKFKSKTDSEVILYSYIEYGEDCLKYFNGQFSFCIYDIKKKELFIARDRLGIRPLYYYKNKNDFIFASELKVILKSENKKFELDKEQINHFFHFGFPDVEKTIFKKIKKLLPGHFLKYDLSKNKIKIKKYWDLKNNIKKKISFSRAKEIIDEKINKSIDYRIISDRPVGAFLSGGLDSSLIVALMSKRIEKLHTFSVTFNNQKYDESKFAKIVSKKFKTIHHELEFNSDDVKRLIKKTSEIYDEPFADPTSIPSYLISKYAKKKVDVCLSGAGADELFFGYKRYHHFKILEKYQRLPQIFKTTISNILSLSKNMKIMKINSILSEKTLENKYSTLFTSSYGPGLKYNKKKYFHFKKNNDPTYFDLKEYLPSNLLYKEDLAGMASSLETRFPYLDHKFVEFVFSLNNKIKSKNNNVKYLLKEVALNYLPREIVYRKKKSFSVPYEEYFRNELKEFTEKQLKEFTTLKIFNEKIITLIWEEHLNKKVNHSEFLLRIIVFNLWHKKWIQK